MNQSRLDLLLVNAPSRTTIYQGLAKDFAAIEPPVWAGLIARYVLNVGFTVQILDAEAEGLTIEETAIRIVKAMPRLAAFCIYGQQPSASTQCIPAAAAVTRLVQFNAEIPTLALGTHPSALPEQTLQEGPFDFVCQGEGPQTIASLLCMMNEPGGSFDLVPGLYWRDGQSTPSRNIEELDRVLPNQAWELLDMKKYRAHNWHLWSGDQNGGYASIQTSLNCVFSCTFCCISSPFGDRKMRFWSPANIATQIAMLVGKYGITNLKIADEMFCLNRQHVWQICNHLIDMGLGSKLNIWAYARVDTVKDEQLLNRMRKAGFKWLGIGVESGSKHVRNGVEKGRFGDEAIRSAIQRVQSAGIHVGANYIFGLPDDTHESVQATLDLACQLNTEWANFYCAQAYPGSPLHAIAKQKGWRLPEDDKSIGWIGYSQHAYETLPLPTETLTAPEVLNFRDAAFMHYFSRPQYLQMLVKTFGTGAVENITRMIELGQPRRKHREKASAQDVVR